MTLIAAASPIPSPDHRERRAMATESTQRSNATNVLTWPSRSVEIAGTNQSAAAPPTSATVGGTGRVPPAWWIAKA
ncbi:MAG: hypothetical protein V9G12_12620 [Microthrixaceae bacterium]